MSANTYDLTMLCLYDVEKLENKENNILALYPLLRSSEANLILSVGNIYDIKKFTCEKRSYLRLNLNDIRDEIITVNAYNYIYLHDYLKPENKLVNREEIKIVGTRYDIHALNTKEINLFKLKYLKEEVLEFLSIKRKRKTARLLYCSKYKKFIIVDCNHTELMNLIIRVDNWQSNNFIEDIDILDLDNNKRDIRKIDYLNFIKQELFIPDYTILETTSYKLFINLFCIETYAELKSFVSDLYKLHVEAE